MRIIWCICLIMVTLATTCTEADEIRILIDVSGSMKHNDPNNLRIPALKLLLELLPPNSQAGVWLFADEPENLIPQSKVDHTWKQQAAKAAERIHSNGQLTDIETVLQVGIGGWQQANSKAGRHIILLTDGMVDVNGTAMKDRASRERILKRLIPELQKLGIHVYTIALSDQADHPLLKQLAVSTNGRNKVAQSAEELQRTFLNIFKSAVPRDTVPLTDNTFKIDPTIEEFSLLVFRQPNSPATELTKPSGEHWTYDKYPENVRWHHEEGYDLITVSTPMPGTWRLQAEIDPDNQVMIVTDLKLKVSPLPNYLLGEEKIALEAELTEHGKRITRENFLRLVQFNLEQDEPQSSRTLLQDQDQPGLFRTNLETFFKPGPHTIRLSVDGKTFQRTWEQNIEVISSPVEVGVEYPAENPGTVILTLTPNPHMIDPTTFEATAIITGIGEPVEKPFDRTTQGQWRLHLDAPPAGHELTVNFQLTALDHDGKPLMLVLKPKMIEAIPPGQEEPVADDEEDSLLEEDEALLIEQDSEEGHQWIQAALIAGAVNLVLLIAGFFLWRWLQQRTRRQHEELLHRLTGDFKGAVS